MAQYIVKPNQNLFDIAIHLYGSIEGIFDLLVTNQDLSMAKDLVAGQVLEYHKDFVINQSIVDGLASQTAFTSNGERKSYYKRPENPYVLGCVLGIDPETPNISFVLGGEGMLLIDWGDNSDIEKIQLTPMPRSVVHYFDNDVDERRIRFYGEPCNDVGCSEYHAPGHLKCTFTCLDISSINGSMAITRPLIVDNFICQSNGFDLAGLFLCEGTYSVDLQHSIVSSLLPLVNMENLQELHLENAIFTSVSVLDEYLQALVNTPTSTGRRSGCKVYLTTEPSEAGYDAIDDILREEEWNTPLPWEFFINGQQYILPS